MQFTKFLHVWFGRSSLSLLHTDTEAWWHCKIEMDCTGVVRMCTRLNCLSIMSSVIIWY